MTSVADSYRDGEAVFGPQWPRENVGWPSFCFLVDGMLEEGEEGNELSFLWIKKLDMPEHSHLRQKMGMCTNSDISI